MYLHFVSFSVFALLMFCYRTHAHTHIHTENSYSQSATSKNKNNCHNNNKNNNNTTTTTLRHYVSKRTHSYTQTDDTQHTHTHALWQNTMRWERRYTRVRSLCMRLQFARAAAADAKRARERAVRAFKHPEDSQLKQLPAQNLQTNKPQ